MAAVVQKSAGGMAFRMKNALFRASLQVSSLDTGSCTIYK